MDDFLPDLSLRHSSAVALIPLSLTYYALGVLAILPNTFLFRLLLQPVFLWQAWTSRRGWHNLSDSRILTVPESGVPHSWCGSLFTIVFFIGVDGNVLHGTEVVRMDIHHQGANKEVRAYNGSRCLYGIEKPLSISSVLLDGLDLFFNLRGIGWSWSPQPSLRWTTAPPSIPSLFASFLFRVTMFDVSRYLIQLACPAVSSSPNGGSIFDPNLNLLPPQSRQRLSPVSVAVYGRRPGALIGAFAVSAVLHHFAMWGIGYGSEFSTAGGFFLLMGVGVAIEVAFKKVTGMRVGGFFGWLWTMLWVLVWGMLMIDAWGRHGMLASEFFPTRLRPGKPLVDAVIGLFNIMGNRWDVGLELNENLGVDFVDDNLAYTEQRVRLKKVTYSSYSFQVVQRVANVKYKANCTTSIALFAHCLNTASVSRTGPTRAGAPA
ncbi:hypothetical protein EDB89DRAFT_1909345 [Lactarius sanguifluus]|nr:hypothetical protein EDB89DRAFT_1909345 [Lactarius sanguifluus]